MWLCDLGVYASLPNFKCQKKQTQHYLPVPYDKHQLLYLSSMYSHFFLQIFPPFVLKDCSTHQSCDFSGCC